MVGCMVHTPLNNQAVHSDDSYLTRKKWLCYLVDENSAVMKCALSFWKQWAIKVQWSVRYDLNNSMWRKFSKQNMIWSCIFVVSVRFFYIVFNKKNTGNLNGWKTAILQCWEHGGYFYYSDKYLKIHSFGKLWLEFCHFSPLMPQFAREKGDVFFQVRYILRTILKKQLSALLHSDLDWGLSHKKSNFFFYLSLQ